MSRPSRSEETPRSEDRSRPRPEMGPNRYWGSKELPTAKTQFFDAVTIPTAEDGTSTVATVRLYGPIDSWGGYWGVSAKDVGELLDALPDSVTQIILRINSPGGEVWEAATILNTLRAHRASVLAVVDGNAASAASFIAAGCDDVVMSPGTTMMIHSPSTITWGNARDLRKDADFLDTIERSLIEVYSAKAGAKDWAALLAEETWLTPAEAVALGLADRVAIIPDAGETLTVGEEDLDLELVLPPEEDDPEDALARISRFASARHQTTQTPVSSEPGTPNRKEPIVGDNPKAGSDTLGATDTGRTEETPVATTSEPRTVTLDAAAFAQLQGDAAAGARALAQQTTERRDRIVQNAIDTGRIAPVAREDWLDSLEANEATAVKLLDSLPENTIPVAEIGHSDTTKTLTVDDQLMQSVGWGEPNTKGA